MREIKFKCYVQFVEEGEWIGLPGMLSDITLSDMAMDYDSLKKKYNIKGMVFPQYTGLKDCKGKPIYEEDILKVPKHYDGNALIQEYSGIVKFDEGSFDVFSVHREWESLSMLAANERIEVIGNQFENPELLEEKLTKKNWSGN